jgi:Rps23 Pro-64 3,4-dihydroxylase Tpa1-like proline 4-hydroxylase
LNQEILKENYEKKTFEQILIFVNSKKRKQLIMSDKKLDKSLISKLNVECIFGNWTERLDEIQELFESAEPFKNVVIDNFLNHEYAEQLYHLFPTNFENWYHYENPIEVKFTYDKINSLADPLKHYFYYLSSPYFISLMSKISGIEDLEYDEYLHGAGLHAHPRDGRLQVHLDYEEHPISGKERRLNIILFMSKDWKEEWNGHTELWNNELTNYVRKIPIKFNRAIIFKTNDLSFHGVSEKIQCPEGTFRKSLAYYFVSPMGNVKKKYRNKATFYQTKNLPYDENFQKLCNIRSERRITNEDVKEYFPEWKKEL